jgi:small multidrug resistance family-3 protein
MPLLISLGAFVLAGLCEIGGGYLVWQWLRERQSAWLGVLGSLLLILYGVIPTLQPASFGRVYAAYGGIFVVMSLLWGWQVDRMPPDHFDLLGGGIVLVGVLVIMYAPQV